MERLRSAPIRVPALMHHEERWRWQQAGLAAYVLAWHGEEVVGRATVLRRSKYDVVRAVLGDVAEVNALESLVPGQGIGTSIMQFAEQQAVQWEAPAIGLGVAPANDRARRLYAHLGYAEWAHGTVCDEWTERNDAGEAGKEHADQCLYLTKQLDP
jgi:GNAT superfamily N-acetyltransferase